MPIPADVLQGLLSQIQLPGLTNNETMISQAWLAQHSAEFDSVQFQVRLGAELDIGLGYPEWARRQAAIQSQKRADIIAMQGDQATIVEVKIRVSPGALGQLLTYRTLWHAEYLSKPVPHLVAIGNDALVDVHDVLAAYGVTVETFPNVYLVKLPEAE